jgi:hypothetical protein
MRRDLVILTARDGNSDPSVAAHGFEPVVDRGRSGLPLVDLPHGDEAARARFGRRRRLPMDALVWLPEGDAVPAALASSYAEAVRYTVVDHVGWRPYAYDPADPADVVKQVSLLAASDGYGEEVFRAHYRHHVGVARRHIHALWQYVQNDVVAVQGGSEHEQAITAVSELWFHHTDDFVNRYFPTPRDEEVFRSHEDFLDLTKAASFIATSHVLDAPGGR